tara:strand:- start:1526 stop:2395 length:870 start_codon:yes stop_codon:yes gene_type:complete
MKLSKSIGIIGKGFVGSAVKHGFTCDKNFKAKIKIYDKDSSLRTHSLNDTVNKSSIVFISIPTPANLNGSINLKIIDELLNDINLCYNGKSILLLRSTLVPGSSKKFAKKYPKLKIVFNPEFLTERNANHDFINQSRVILGGEKELTQIVAKLYKERFGNSLPIVETNFETAEMIKYMNNCFLATKVSFMNEMKIISDKTDVNWEQAVKAFNLDPRMGNSHFNVPGHDGKIGFGGSCLPKDIQALIYFASTLKIDSRVLKAVWETNVSLRPEKDWEKLKGRAVSSDNSD